jgi:hypothetical protein
MAKLFVFNKIAQFARDRWSHLCAAGYTAEGWRDVLMGSLAGQGFVRLRPGYGGQEPR